MNGTRRKLLVGVLAVGVLGLILFSVATARRTPAYPPLPDPNGYTELAKASKLVTGPIGDYPTLPEQELRSLVATNGEALRLCRLALNQTCAVPTEAAITNFATDLPALGEMKRLAQLLAAEGRLAELEHRPGDAARSYADSMRLGDAISHGGFIIHRLVGIAMEAIGGTRLARLVQQLKAEECRSLIQALEDIDRRGVTWEEVLHGEKLFARHELRKLPNLLGAVISWWKNRPMIARTQQRHDSAVAHRRLLIAELALRLSQLENQRVPASLQELVPKYLPRVPVDPFGDQPLRYRAQSTNWLLYSVGPDRIDNGGIPGGGDLFYSSSW